MKINCDPFLKAFLLLAIFFFAAFVPGQRKYTGDKYAKLKSRLKQIGTTVAMYYTDGDDARYPKDPSLFEIDESLLLTDQVSNWLDINLNSPYFFFPYEGDEYTGSAEKPLAMNWEPFPVSPHYQIVWEDGHVSSIPEEEAFKLMHSNFKNSLSVLLYKLLAKKNEAF